MISLAQFAAHLLSDGLIYAFPWDNPSHAERLAAVELLRVAHSAAAWDAPGTAPDFNSDAATWGLEVVQWASFVLVDRSDTRVELPPSLASLEPAGQSPAEHWSVDLALHFLPCLIQRSARLAADDPFTQSLLEIAARWPLAGVGLSAELDSSRLQLLVEHECLRCLLVDRILAAADRRLAEHPLLKPWVARAVGLQRLFKLGANPAE